MADVHQRRRLRADTGTNEDSLTNDEIDEIYEEAEATYSDSASADAQARIIVFQRLMAQAASRTDYKQNQSQESLSDLIKNYQIMLKLWEGKLASAVTASTTSGSMRMGKGKRVPSRLKEYPDA